MALLGNETEKNKVWLFMDVGKHLIPGTYSVFLKFHLQPRVHRFVFTVNITGFCNTDNKYQNHKTRHFHAPTLQGNVAKF